MGETAQYAIPFDLLLRQCLNLKIYYTTGHDLIGVNN